MCNPFWLVVLVGCKYQSLASTFFVYIAWHLIALRESRADDTRFLPVPYYYIVVELAMIIIWSDRGRYRKRDDSTVFIRDCSVRATFSFTWLLRNLSIFLTLDSLVSFISLLYLAVGWKLRECFNVNALFSFICFDELFYHDFMPYTVLFLFKSLKNKT